MSSPRAEFRLAVALGHALPGGRVEIDFADGRAVRAVHGAVAPELNMCELRVLAARGASPVSP